MRNISGGSEGESDMNLYLIRHGETDWNAEGRLQGQMDIPLNEKGMEQMLQVAEKMKQLGIEADSIVTSPLQRAKQSAGIVSAILGYNVEDISVEPLLTERSFGEGEGKSWSELVAQYPEGICAGYEPFEGVEPLEALLERGQAAFDKIVGTYAGMQNIIVVAHGAILSAMVDSITNGKLEYGSGRVAFCQGSIYVVRCLKETIDIAGYDKEKEQFLLIEKGAR